MKNEFFTEKFYYTIATVFGVGYSPVMPGTAGTLAGLILCILLHQFTFIYILVFLGLFAAGVASSTRVEEDCAVKDPSFIVIDEAACIFAAFLFMPLSLATVVFGFAIFRIIDIVKIPPMKKIEKAPGGWGIMLDDLAAGIYTNIILQILRLLNILP